MVDGQCAPPETSRYRPGSGSFSVGCFQWVSTKDGSGLKRGKVVKRFRGPLSDPGKTYDRARAWCEEANAAR